MGYDTALLGLVMHFEGLCDVVLGSFELDRRGVQLSFWCVCVSKIELNLCLLCVRDCCSQVPNSNSLCFTSNHQMLILLTENHRGELISCGSIVATLLGIYSNLFVYVAHFEKRLFWIMPIADDELVVLVAIRCEERAVHGDVPDTCLMVAF